MNKHDNTQNKDKSNQLHTWDPKLQNKIKYESGLALLIGPLLVD